MNRKTQREHLALLQKLLQEPPVHHTVLWTRWLNHFIARLQAYLDPRAELTRRFPRAAQPFLTWLTGKAGAEEPLWQNTALSAYGVNLATLLGAPAAATALLMALPNASAGGRVLLGVGVWISTLATAGAARAGTSTFLHHATHGTYPAPAWWEAWQARRQAKQGAPSPTAKREAREAWNRLVGESISTLGLLAPYDLYRRDHRIHHSQALATLDDPDWKFLFKFGGFRPSQSVRSYWLRMGRTLVSPRFHFRFLRARLYDNFLNPETPRYRRLMAQVLYGSLTALLALALVHGITTLLLFFLVWAFAIGPINQAGSLLQLLSEHKWNRVPDSDSKKVVLARKTRGRFVAPTLPDAALPLPLRWLAWYNWGLRTLLWHLPVERLWVWPAELPSHDWHHRHVGGDWPNSPYARRADIAEGTPGWEEPYQEDVWGLREALGEVFALLSSLPPHDGPDRLTGAEEAETFRAM